MEISEIVNHSGAQSDERPFCCQFDGCNKGFARRSDLVRHARIHTNDRPFKCRQFMCNRSFIQRSALTVHMRTHTGEKPHICEYPTCNKRFSDSSSLARHRRIHTGKKPYRCPADNCSKGFVRKTALIQHMKQEHPAPPSSGSENDSRRKARIQWFPFFDERRQQLLATEQHFGSVRQHHDPYAATACCWNMERYAACDTWLEQQQVHSPCPSFSSPSNSSSPSLSLACTHPLGAETTRHHHHQQHVPSWYATVAAPPLTPPQQHRLVTDPSTCSSIPYSSQQHAMSITHPVVAKTPTRTIPYIASASRPSAFF